MSTEYLLGMESSGASGHYVTHIVAGNIETVRASISAAMERCGYTIIAEEPVVLGRRGARGWAEAMASSDVMDYPATLTVRLKADSAFATRATFDYVVKHPMLTKGDKRILSREAKAIAALATSRATPTVCSGCGVGTTDDSKFCRRCGAPISADIAELEVLRIAAETRAGQSNFLMSAIFSGIAFLFAFFAFLVFGLKGDEGIKVFTVLMILFGVFAALGLAGTFFGLGRLKRAINTKETNAQPQIAGARQQVLPPVPEAFSARTDPFAREAPLPQPPSVTEGTTGLMTHDDENAQPVQPPPRDASTRA